MIIATKNIQDIDADVVLVRDNDVFAGKLRPDIAQGNDVESLIQQNIWQISKLTKSEGMGGTIYAKLYPNGDTSFSYKLSEIDNYMFLLRRQ